MSSNAIFLDTCRHETAMPRPADTYTNNQFERIGGANSEATTVQCVHCKRWQGNARVLNRKKAHLQSCPEYAAWRAEGNGQELAPPNLYNVTGRSFGDLYGRDDSSLPSGPILIHTMQRPRSTLDMSKYFDEFFDRSLGHKCARVRCKSCGFVRAKNVTRQAEHLIQCKEFLSATEGTELLASGSQALNEQQGYNPAIWNGETLNPEFLVNRHGPNSPRGSMAPSSISSLPFLPRTPQPAEAPSLAQHLLFQDEDLLTNATRHDFLSHAGCGSLTDSALNQWLTQIGYISRSLVPFTGALIGKIRIPETANLERDATFRCLDLLCSAVNNVKKELEFLEATKRKYGLHINFDEPKQPTKGFIDLFHSASCPSATLLEGMVMLWAIEILFYNSFSYAGTFVNRTIPTPQQNSLPSNILSSGEPTDPYSDQTKPKNGHTTALREAFIENWKSENFGRFVNACKSIVDELAMAQTSGNGQAEMSACERVFKQAVLLWGQMFPEVTGMGELDELADRQNTPDRGDNGSINGTGSADKSVEIDDDVAHASADLP